jgi:hypothetical protein
MGCSTSSSAASNTDLDLEAEASPPPSRFERVKKVLSSFHRHDSREKNFGSFNKLNKKDFIRRAFQRNVVTRSEISPEVVSSAGMDAIIDSMAFKRFGDGELLFLQGSMHTYFSLV